MRIVNEGGSFQLYCWCIAGVVKKWLWEKREIFSQSTSVTERRQKSCIATQSPIKRHHEQLQLVTQRPEWWFGNAKMGERNWGSILVKLYLICCNLPTTPVKSFIEIWGSTGFESLVKSEYFKKGLLFMDGLYISKHRGEKFRMKIEVEESRQFVVFGP